MECSSETTVVAKEGETERQQEAIGISETSTLPVTEGWEKASTSVSMKRERPAVEIPETPTGSFFELHAAAAKIDGPVTVTISNTYNYSHASPKRKRLCLKKKTPKKE